MENDKSRHQKVLCSECSIQSTIPLGRSDLLEEAYVIGCDHCQDLKLAKPAAPTNKVPESKSGSLFSNDCFSSPIPLRSTTLGEDQVEVIRNGTESAKTC